LTGISIMKTKICTKCKHVKSIGDFYADRRNPNGLQSHCKKCMNKRSIKHQKTKKGKAIHNKACSKYNKTVKGRAGACYYETKRRCEDKRHKKYKHYGGRGIGSKFKSRAEFVDYVVDVLKVDPRRKQIHRIDNDGDYEKGNIEFLACKKHLEKHKKVRSE